MTAHEWLLELVQAAEELGYQVRSIEPQSVTLTRKYGGNSYLDVTIHAGPLLAGSLLRSVLVPVEKPGVMAPGDFDIGENGAVIPR